MKACIPLLVLITCSLHLSGVSQQKTPAPQNTPNSGGLTPSVHRHGPHGLEGWTLDGPIPDEPEARYPFTLLTAGNSKEIRRFAGDPFVWKWMFLADGRQVAYESGPLHFGMTCILADVQTGRKLSSYDCYTELPDDSPDWVDALERAP